MVDSTHLEWEFIIINNIAIQFNYHVGVTPKRVGGAITLRNEQNTIYFDWA